MAGAYLLMRPLLGLFGPFPLPSYEATYAFPQQVRPCETEAHYYGHDDDRNHNRNHYFHDHDHSRPDYHRHEVCALLNPETPAAAASEYEPPPSYEDSP